MSKRRQLPDPDRRRFLKGATLAGAAAMATPVTATAQVAAPRPDLKAVAPGPIQTALETSPPDKDPVTQTSSGGDFMVDVFRTLDIDYLAMNCASSFRGLQIPLENVRTPLAPFELLGQRNYGPGSPAGWPDRSADWDGGSALMKRIEWADAVGQKFGNRRDAAELAPQLLGETLTNATRTAIGRAASGSQAVTLLMAAPEFMRR